jgi:asparagine synthase (glutamine-hydrolysing)
MCGIAGMIDWRAATTAESLRDIGARMASALSHRGPDGEDVWVEAQAGAMLAHRRLAIIDLDARASQPMRSADGRFVIVFNGEIYNYGDIRRELSAAGRSMRTQSDTEALLEGCALWGVEATVRRTVGMFAFALWDRQTRTLSLARDRLGIKPLYYAESPERVIFGSQLRAFRQAPGWSPSLDTDAIAGYLRHAYIAQPLTVYREARKLPPGHILTLRAGAAPALSCYWDLRAIARAGVAHRGTKIDAHGAVERLDFQLRQAVASCLIADVSLGAFLSGGIDSSTVVALMQAQSERPVKTFSIGFQASGYDESAHAAEVARHIGTDHTAFQVEPGHALEVIPRLADTYDEPFADSSQIPTYLVAEMTRRRVTVALSGDGGDEVFGGYNRHVWAARMAFAAERLPYGLRKTFAAWVRAFSPAQLDAMCSLVPARWRPRQAGDKLYKMAGFTGESDLAAIYRRLVSQWPAPEQLMPCASEPRGLAWDARVAEDFPDPIDRLQFLDTATYLPDDALVKVDRATMAVGLEARVPLLDHRLVEHAWQLPLLSKVGGGQGKWILRRVLERYVPRPLFERPKMGFAVPIDSWLRGPLRDWAESLLAPSRLAADGLLQPEPIRQAWAEHLSGRRNWQHQLWTVLMLQAWKDRWD